MKYLESLFAISIIIFCSGTMITSCMESNTRVDNIHDTVQSAKEKHSENTSAYNEEFEAFKIELLKKYENNKEKITRLKANKTENIKSSYNIEVEKLENENENMKYEIEHADIKSELEWKNFKNTREDELQRLEESLNKL